MSKKMSIILLTIIAIILGLWIWSAAAPKNSIILGGSTSVNPFMQKLTKKYYDSDEGGTDFIYNSTGSQAGVGGVEKGMYSAGFISKNINEGTLTKGNSFLDVCVAKNTCNFKDVEKIPQNKSKSESYVALEFAIDAIAVIFNSPSYWSEEVVYGENKTITLNDLMNFNLEKPKKGSSILTRAYDGKTTWEELAKLLIDENKNQPYNDQLLKKVKEQSKSNKIVTYTREDGSGTRTAFSDLTGIKDMHSSSVANSNGSMIEGMSGAPSIGYVSNGFLGQLSEDGTIKVAGINGNKLAVQKSNDPKKWDTEKFEWVSALPSPNQDENNKFISEIYEFKRPFIAIFNAKTEKLDELLELFNWMNEHDEAKEVFEDEGLVKEMKYQSPIGGTYA